MIRFGCPMCSTVLQAEDDQAGGKVGCPKCGQRLQVPGQPPANRTVLGSFMPGPEQGVRPGPEQPSAPAAAPAQEAAWFYNRQGQQCGPFTFPQMQQLAIGGQLAGGDLVWRQGMGTWLPADKVGGLPLGGRRGIGKPLAWLAGLAAIGGIAAAVVFVVLPRLNQPAANANAVARNDDGKKNADEKAPPVVQIKENKDEGKGGKPMPPAAKDDGDKVEPKKPEPAPKKPEPPAKQSLAELNRKLSPSVPLIECPGAGTGSGFLLVHGGRKLVVTNRHVIEHARNGILVHFLREKNGAEERLEVPRAKARLVAVDREVDLAVIDVSDMAAEIDAWGLTPVALMPGDHKTAQGDEVFAIGHPGTDGGGGVLTRTISKGIVSAVNRKDKFFKGSFLQVQVAINPGNSGGPVFNDEGKVVGVATFVMRRGDRMSLEGLNFALDVRHVHELLADPGRSMTAQEITAMLQAGGMKGPPAGDHPLVKQFNAKLKQLQGLGYQPFTGDLKTSLVQIKLKGNGDYLHTLQNLLPKHDVYVFVLSEGSKDVDLHIFDFTGKLVVQDIRVNPDPEVNFVVLQAGNFQVRVSNLDAQPCEAVMVLMLK